MPHTSGGCPRAQTSGFCHRERHRRRTRDISSGNELLARCRPCRALSPTGRAHTLEHTSCRCTHTHPPSTHPFSFRRTAISRSGHEGSTHQHTLRTVGTRCLPEPHDGRVYATPECARSRTFQIICESSPPLGGSHACASPDWGVANGNSSKVTTVPRVSAVSGGLALRTSSVVRLNEGEIATTERGALRAVCRQTRAPHVRRSRIRKPSRVRHAETGPGPMASACGTSPQDQP